jgi:hypothetical protein
MPSPLNPMDFCEQEVLPRLFEILPRAFPEFGWRRTQRGWVATQRVEGLGVRPDRVICNVPYGFYVHGGQAVTWLAYVSRGSSPRGQDYVRAVRQLAVLGGVDTSPLDRPFSPEVAEQAWRRERVAALLEAFLHLTRARLLADDEPGRQARSYLVQRGFLGEELEHLDLGLYPSAAHVEASLSRQGFGIEEVREAALTPPSWDVEKRSKVRLWEGRLVGALRDHRGVLRSFWARDLSGQAEPEKKYLYLAGVKKSEVAPFGLYEALGSPAGREQLVLVEGVLDVLLLQQRGLPNTAALGGVSLGQDGWRRLAQLGVRSVVLALDHDPHPDGRFPGWEATLKLLQAGGSEPDFPRVYAIDPVDLWRRAGQPCDPAGFAAKVDPAELVQRQGVGPLQELVALASHGFRVQARALVRHHQPLGGWSDLAQEALIAEAMAFDGTQRAPRVDELQRYFWPEIQAALGADGEALQARIDAVRAQRAAQQERREDEVWLQGALDRVKQGDVAGARTALQERLAVLRAQEQARPAEPVRAAAEELAALQERLARWRGAEFLGLPQRTLPGLDGATLGLRGLMLLAAAPNVGKTALAVQLGVDVVANNLEACFLFVSLEMSRWDILTRIRCRLAGMDWADVVFGTARQRGRGLEADWSLEEAEALRQADAQLAELGHRILILDERNCPTPTVDVLLSHLAALKERTGAQRAFVLVDYLQVWPIPEGEMRQRSDLEADKWRIGAMKALRDGVGGDPVMVISEARKPSGQGGESWGGALADVMGSARGSYTPDIVLLLRPYTEEELIGAFEEAGESAPSARDRAERERWMGTTRERLQKEGKSLLRLSIVKGRDGVRRDSFALTFRYRRACFEELHSVLDP